MQPACQILCLPCPCHKSPLCISEDKWWLSPTTLWKQCLENVCQEMMEFINDGGFEALLMKSSFALENAHMFLGNLFIPLPPNPPEPFEALLDCLVESVMAVVNEDDHFVFYLTT